MMLMMMMMMMVVVMIKIIQRTTSDDLDQRAVADYTMYQVVNISLIIQILNVISFFIQ